MTLRSGSFDAARHRPPIDQLEQCGLRGQKLETNQIRTLSIRGNLGIDMGNTQPAPKRPDHPR